MSLAPCADTNFCSHLFMQNEFSVPAVGPQLLSTWFCSWPVEASANAPATAAANASSHHGHRGRNAFSPATEFVQARGVEHTLHHRRCLLTVKLRPPLTAAHHGPAERRRVRGVQPRAHAGPRSPADLARACSLRTLPCSMWMAPMQPPFPLQPRTVAAILTTPLEPAAASYVGVPASGTIRWDTHAVSNAVQAAVSQIFPAQPPGTAPAVAAAALSAVTLDVLELRWACLRGVRGKRGHACEPSPAPAAPR